MEKKFYPSIPVENNINDIYILLISTKNLTKEQLFAVLQTNKLPFVISKTSNEKFEILWIAILFQNENNIVFNQLEVNEKDSECLKIDSFDKYSKYSEKEDSMLKIGEKYLLFLDVEKVKKFIEKNVKINDTI